MDRNQELKKDGTDDITSLSARRAWIEIDIIPPHKRAAASLSARRAWIEMWRKHARKPLLYVALRKESVDRNIKKQEEAARNFRRSPQGERG